MFVSDVLQLVLCTSDCLVYFSLFWLMYFQLFDVFKSDILPIVWCTSACLITQAYWTYFSLFWFKYFDCLMYLRLMYFRLFDVLQLVSRTSDCLMYLCWFWLTYFRLSDVLQLVWLLKPTGCTSACFGWSTSIVWCTSACFTYFSLFYVLQLTKNFAELRWSKNWYNWYCNTDPSRRVLPPTKQRFIAHCTLQTICLLVRNHHRLRTEFYWKLKRSYSESETRFSQSNYNAQLVGRTGVESGSFNKTDRKTGPGLHGFRFLLISHNLYILHRR